MAHYYVLIQSLTVLIVAAVVRFQDVEGDCDNCEKKINKFCCRRPEKVFQQDPQKKIYCDFSSQAVPDYSSDELQSAVCSKNPETIEQNSISIRHSNEDVSMDQIRLIKCCGFTGTFIFYSEPYYEGDIRYADHGDENYLYEMRPAKSRLNYVRSFRVVGNLDDWSANYVTFYSKTNFRGQSEMKFNDDDPGSDTSDTYFVPASAVVIGNAYWTVYGKNIGDERYTCRVMVSKVRETGHPRFYQALPSTSDSTSPNQPNPIVMKITRVQQGCLCPSDPDVYC